jgi:3D (Asp-Asp-Asp) domain-containing protein
MGHTFHAKGTGYFPDSSTLEGGFKDIRDNPLNTLQDFLQGRAKFVSVAMDENLHIRYGTKIRIPELDKKFGKPIEFRVVDIGGDLKGKGHRRVDICVENEKASLDPAINTSLTLEFP